ncbi:hypothetical protein GCM10009633_22660 [Janibacter melonis]
MEDVPGVEAELAAHEHAHRGAVEGQTDEELRQPPGGLPGTELLERGHRLEGDTAWCVHETDGAVPTPAAEEPIMTKWLA